MKKGEQYSLKNFESTYTKIVDMKNNPSEQYLPDLLTQMGKFLVWGDRHESDYFQYFCEVKALDLLLEIFGRAKAKQIVTAIIGFFNMLLTNIEKKQTITYLLSHPCVLSLQNIKFVSLDNEIAEYYINFLKGLARKLDLNTLHLFFNKRYPAFPLLLQTIRFYNHPESLVRTTCRNILLTTIKLPHPKMTDYVGGFPFIFYYIHQCNFLKEYWMIVDRIVDSDGDNKYELQCLDSIVEDQEEILVFFDDFMRINPVIGDRLVDAFTNQCLCPLLQALYSPKKTNFSLKVALFVVALMLKNITDQHFLELLAYALFGKYYPSQIALKLIHPVEKPISYSKQWKFKGFWDGHQNNINQFCSERYHNSKKIISDVHAEKEEHSRLSGSFNSDQSYSSRVKSMFGMGTNFYDREVEKLQHIFGIPIRADPETFKRKSTSQIMKQFYMQLHEPLNLKLCEQNPVKQVIISFLSSKDDSLMILTLNIIKRIIKNKHIRQEVKKVCGLSTEPTMNDFSSMMPVEKIIKSCVSMLGVEPPSFRICTYKYAAEVTQALLGIYKLKAQLTNVPQQLISAAKKAMKTGIEHVVPYLYGNDKWQATIEIYNIVSGENKKKKSQTLDVFGLVPKQQKQSSIEDVYSSFPNTEQQHIAYNLWLYVIIRENYCYISGQRYETEVTVCEKSTKGSAFQIGNKCQVAETEKMRAKCKDLYDDNFEDCEIIYLGGYVVVSKHETVEYKCAYHEAVMTIDRSDPRKVLLSMGKTLLTISLSDVKKAYELRHNFSEMKKHLYKCQLSELVKQTEELLQKIQ